MITAVVFDLDGLLADTERLHRQAWQETLAHYGVAVPDRVYEDHWIRDGHGIAEFVRIRGLALDAAVARERKADRYEALVRAEATPMPGAPEALARLHGHKALALATSSYRRSASAVLETLGFEGYFDCILAHGDAPRLKPFPDLFLATAARLGVMPAQCLVLEDAQKGIVAAHAAGMRSIAIPNEHTRTNDFTKATLVLASLEPVTVELVEEVGRRYPAPVANPEHGAPRAPSPTPDRRGMQ
jgi:HAD superfamily hydrolase (TIGR01509 family)